ncbi:tubby-like F-box protein 3 [Cucumis melo var. makuwa]|uniref:Tubby-like F-box protein n=1 Tax=Cucumis melo var. makuwa TaxID=1194695 RepID=A0A5A7U2G3_CUCMM|nr:tubby-like F-box protein 3 [Cucumis melo var. makuwa]TYK16117.1 tubby-like F-box protein 3 [Cucumis melo var. makuwa]
MSLKSIIQEMRSRSRRVVQDGSTPEVGDALAQSCWAYMPQELLREVLVRIESSENAWPPRKTVVACAGVCRSWRRITKEIVKTPEFAFMCCNRVIFFNLLSACLLFLKFSGSISRAYFWSVIQPGPRDLLLHCFIKRNRSAQTYCLYLSLTSALADDGKFLLAARKCRRATCTDYIISLHADDMSKASGTFVGKLRSNFLGTKFTIFDGQPPHAGAKISKSRSSRLVGLKQVSPKVPAGNYPVAHISYELNVLGSRGPRRMHCVMDAIPASSIEPGGVAPIQTEFSPSRIDFLPSLRFSWSKSNHTDNQPSGSSTNQKDGVLVLRNKAPRWHEQLQCWCLNFHGRVTIASVKNFQLVASPENGVAGPEHEKIILQFGKVGKDIFTMDYRYPISAFQAFAICLSSFDTKIACE